MWRGVRPALALLATIHGATAPFAAEDPTAADDSIRRKVAEVRKIAEAVRIDGRPGDWAGIPVAEDAVSGGEARDIDPSKRIVRVAIAPRADALLVRIDTSARPSRDPFTFWFDVDIAGDPRPDLRVGIGGGRDRDTLFLADDRKWVGPYPIVGVRRAIAGAAEFLVPYASIAEHAPPALAGALSGPDARSWLRVTPKTWDEPRHVLLHHGPAIASFRLDPEGPPLDPPVPREGRATRPVRLPVDGTWLVLQGPFGRHSHADLWACDLTRVDIGFRASTPEESRENADYLAWDRPVVGRATARVLRATRDQPDQVPWSQARGSPNQIDLELGGELALRIAHLRDATLAVGRGSMTRERQVLGRVGNSGTSTFPHLHLEVVHRGTGASRPLALAGVRVKLNDRADDPWARDLDAWIPREGFFVEDRASDDRMKPTAEGPTPQEPEAP